MKTNSILTITLFVFLISCTSKDVNTLQKTISTPASFLNMLSTPLPPNLSQSEFKDVSGKVTIKIFTSVRHYGPSISASLAVSPDYVLVGGGAFIDTWSKNGAFIMESRPKEDLTAWIVGSSSFLEPECHYLTVYAIGLKIEGIPAATLKSKMKVFSQTSVASILPSITLPMNSSYKLIGGGAKTNSIYPLRANMSYQESWLAETIQTPTATTVSAYTIGIDKVFLSTNRLNISQFYPPSSLGFYPRLTSAKHSLPRGWVLTTVGSRTNPSPNSGRRMLVCMYPVNGTMGEMLTKDHATICDGKDLITLIGIQKY